MADLLTATLSAIRERVMSLCIEDLDRAVPAVREALEDPRSPVDYHAACVAEAALKTYYPIYRADVTVLLAAVDAVLAPHQPGRNVVFGSVCKRHESHPHFSITAREADDVRACPDCEAHVFTSCAGCGQHMSADACPVRLIITRELAKGEATP